MKRDFRFRFSVACACLVIVFSVSGIIYFKISSNNLLNKAQYFMYTKSYDEKQTENKTQNVTVSEHEFTTSSDLQNSQNNNGKHGSSGGSSSHGSAQKQKMASQKGTTAAPVTTAAPITTEKAKVFDDIFVYSEATKKVHSRSCPYVKGIDENNYYYINANEADKLFDEGYEFCSYCKGYVINE